MAERPEDLNLPLAVVSRIIKESLPADINVSKEARQAISKAASVFVLYATSCANNFALKGKRKTLAANDIFQAMGEMEFERFVPELKKSLEAFTSEKQAKNEKKKQQKENKENAKDSAETEKAEENSTESAAEKESAQEEVQEEAGNEKKTEKEREETDKNGEGEGEAEAENMEETVPEGDKLTENQNETNG